MDKVKLEKQLSGNNIRSAWQGMKEMAGCKEGIRNINLNGFSSAKQFAQKLNTFYLRFDDNFKSENYILKQDSACCQYTL